MTFNKPSLLDSIQSDWKKDLLLLAIMLIIFYAFAIGTYPLFTPDEGRYSEVAREMVATGDYITPRVDGIPFLDKPILYYWLQAVAIFLFGVKEWALRLFPMLFGVAGAITTYICGRLLFDRRTGLFAAIILATMPLYYCGAHYANLDLEVAVLISNALLCYLTAMHLETRNRFYFCMAAYIFSALAVLTKGLIGIAFPCMIVGAWMVLTGRYDILKRSYLSLGIIVFAAIVLPWYILVQQHNPAFFHYFFVTQHVTRFLSGAEFNNKTPFWFYIPVLIVGTFPWSIFLFTALKSQVSAVWSSRKKHTIELFLLLWIAIIFIFFSIPHSKILTYLLPIFPALALLTGRYFAQNWQHDATLKSEHQVFIFAFSNLAFALIIFAVGNYFWHEMSLGFRPYLHIIELLFITAAVFAVFFSRYRLSYLFKLTTSISALFLATLILGAFHLNQNSAKPLVLYLKSIIQPYDEVIAYYKYFQDVPLYLERRVSIVVSDWNSPNIINKDNWLRELWFGKDLQENGDWLLNDSAFWQHWHSDKRIFVFLNANYFAQFKQHAKYYFVLGKMNDILLLSNKPTVLSFKHPGLSRTPISYWR